MHDYDTGLDMKSFRVTADFAIDGVKAGDNLAAKFKTTSQGVWEHRLDAAVDGNCRRGVLTVSSARPPGERDARIVRTISSGTKSTR